MYTAILLYQGNFALNHKLTTSMKNIKNVIRRDFLKRAMVITSVSYILSSSVLVGDAQKTV